MLKDDIFKEQTLKPADFKYPEITDNDSRLRNLLLAIILPLLGFAYLFVRYLKKSGKMKE
jgi:hypothetical protein